MNPIFLPAALLLNRMPYAIKVFLMVTCSLIPTGIFAWFALVGSNDTSLKYGLSTFAGIMLLIFVYVASAYYASLKHALHRFHSVLEHMSHGDMTVRMEIDHKDEIGEISISFNHMIEKFEALVQQISSATGQLAAAAEEMSTVARNADHNINKQTQETEQVATAMNEMGATDGKSHTTRHLPPLQRIMPTTKPKVARPSSARRRLPFNSWQTASNVRHMSFINWKRTARPLAVCSM